MIKSNFSDFFHALNKLFAFLLHYSVFFCIFVAVNYANMFYIQKTLTISAAHNLNLSYESKCEQLHGHNWVITVYCKAKELNKDGMVTDFTHIKRVVKDTFDHKYLNDVLDVNPSAENIARWICEHVENCYKVSAQESEGNVAIYEKD